MAQVFYCEFCETFKNTFFTEHLWATVSVWANVLFSSPSLTYGYLKGTVA